MLLRADAFSPFEYRPVSLPQLDLELGDNSTLVARLDDGEAFIPLQDQAFEQLVEYLGAPFGFAKKLKNAGRGHVLAYLHKQLSQASGETTFYAVTHPEQGLVGLSLKENLLFTGHEAIELDQRIGDYLAQASCPFSLKKADIHEGKARYLLFLKNEQELLADKVAPGEELKPLWRWGFELRHSIWGQEVPAFHVSLERMICANLTYMPEEKYLYPLKYEQPLDVRLQEVLGFLENPPEPNWNAVARLIERLRCQQASVAEVKKVRNSILGLFREQESDTETKQRLEEVFDWKDIVDAYGLKEMDEKPSPQWFKRASTPHNLYDLYNILTREVTHAPNTVNFEKRQALLVLAGTILTKKPDLEDLPPRIDWMQRELEKRSTYRPNYPTA